MELLLEGAKSELVKLQEKVKDNFAAHKEDTDQVVAKFMDGLGT